ncbi:MAG: hypothetical protein GPJ54_06165 [Candidatus Heimdallarchaeota archaeon]|nr:hypothetical protein [Candidatus Heimdallarchaeota archaeon]
MILDESEITRLRKILLKELGDNVLVEQIFLTIKLYVPPEDNEIKVIWESEWTNLNQINPWFAKIVSNGTNIKRIYQDCKADYKSSNKKLVQKKMEVNLRIGTVVEYISGGNSKRSLHYYGIITKYGLYQLGEIDDKMTIIDFLSTFTEDRLTKISEEHGMIAELEYI